jgi:hypothetical protein
MVVLAVVADVLKANDEVIRVMALYEDVIIKSDDNNLLIDADEHSRTVFTTLFLIICFGFRVGSIIMDSLYIRGRSYLVSII